MPLAPAIAATMPFAIEVLVPSATAPPQTASAAKETVRISRRLVRLSTLPRQQCLCFLPLPHGQGALRGIPMPRDYRCWHGRPSRRLPPLAV